MRKFEFTFTDKSGPREDRQGAFMEELDRLGSEGWELVSVTSPTVDQHGDEVHSETAYFKREILEKK